MTSTAMPRSSKFDRLFEIRRDFDRLMNRLREIHLRVDQASGHLADPSRNAGVARVYLNRALAQYRVTMDLLREARREAHEILANYDQAKVDQHAA